MKPEDDERLHRIVDWYVNQIDSIRRTAQKRNVAFLTAAKYGTDLINSSMDHKIAEAFPEADRMSLARLKVITSRFVKERLDETFTTIIESESSTLTNYLGSMTALLEAAREMDGALRSLDGRAADEGTQQARLIWAAMRNARVFDFMFSDFETIWQAADKYTTEKIAKCEYTTDRSKVPDMMLDAETNKRYIDSIEEAGARVPFPEALPFDSVYIGFGHGVALSREQLFARIGENADRTIGNALLGYVIWGGNAVELLQVVEPDDNFIMPNIICFRGVWQQPVLNLGPWIVTHLIAVINEHRQIVIEPTKPSFATKRDFDKARKKYRVTGMVPKPYYVVRMERRLIDDTGKRVRAELSKISRELSYRHDRRGHERCYVRRGALPLSASDEKKMIEAGYKIWTINEPNSNAYRQLMERGYPPKSAGEWVAILTKWIDSQIIGPEDKPYVPAMRLPQRSA